MNLDATIVTDDPKQLPPDFQRLVDPQQPLPPEMRFFEERKTWRSLAQRVGVSLVLILVGLLLIAADLGLTQLIGEIDLFVFTLIGLAATKAPRNPTVAATASRGRARESKRRRDPILGAMSRERSNPCCCKICRHAVHHEKGR